LERQIRAKGGRIQFVEGAVVEHHFDPKRLERSAWIQHAKASGRSDAYIFHHWHRGSMQLLALRRAKKLIQFGLCTLSRWRRRQAGSPIDSREIGLINYLAFLKQVAIQRGTHPKYSERCAESASADNIHSNLRKRKSYRNAKLGFTPGP
jgi:hypothetical protein